MVGWLVVERFARRRETRSDLRNAISTFTDAVEEVRVASITYYGIAGNDPQSVSLAATINAKIGALSDQLNIMRDAGLKIDSDELLKRFRQSVTSGDFESLARVPLPATAPIFVRIAGDGQALSRAVQTEMTRFLLPPQRIKWGRRLRNAG